MVPMWVHSQCCQAIVYVQYSIKSIFSNLVGEEEASKIAVIANDVEILPDGHFKVKYRHPDSFVPSCCLYTSDR